MRYIALLVALLLAGSLTAAPAQAQMLDPDGLAPAAEPGEGPDDIDIPPRQRRPAPEPDPEEESFEPAPAERPQEQTLIAQQELEADVARARAEAISDEELERAARVLARANAIYDEHRERIKQARLEGDDARYQALRERVEVETEAAAEELGIDIHGYNRVLRIIHADPQLRERFFAKLTRSAG